MDAAKKARLEAAGYTVGSVQDFLELTDAESMLIEIKLALGKEIKATRAAKHMTQKQLAVLVQTSQPRVVTMEYGDATLDLLTRALIALGVDRERLGELVARGA